MDTTNGVIMQYFQWYTKADGTLWNELAHAATGLAQKGITAVWIPPCSKGSGGGVDVGYGAYDLFDLGEFDQKGSVRTKYGTRDELLKAIKAVQDSGMQCYADVVFNHKDAGDETEVIEAQQVAWDNRNYEIGEKVNILGFTRFTFPGRGTTYSSMQWYWWCFDAISYDDYTKSKDKLYRLKDKHFETPVSHEHGNYDYLMANDLDTSNEFVRGELSYWGKWFVETTAINGFRIDAVKHIRSSFFRNWLNDLRTHFNQEFFSVGEYWSGDIRLLHNYLSDCDGVMSLFDVPLHYKFYKASYSGNSFDMRTILDDTLMKENPARAVTFVDNHDSQPCQSLQSPVQDWFKPLAYAVILLRREGYPCIFYADYYGAEYIEPKCGHFILGKHSWLIDHFLWARKAYGFGDQESYFDHPNTIGWTRLGNVNHPGAMAVVLSNGSDGYKWMNMYRINATFQDITEHIGNHVITNHEGWGRFECKGGKVSVWLQQ